MFVHCPLSWLISSEYSFNKALFPILFYISSLYISIYTLVGLTTDTIPFISQLLSVPIKLITYYFRFSFLFEPKLLNGFGVWVPWNLNKPCIIHIYKVEYWRWLSNNLGFILIFFLNLQQSFTHFATNVDLHRKKLNIDTR